MSKSQAIRDALAAIGGPASLTDICAKVEEITGADVDQKKTGDLCGYLVRTGEITCEGDGDGRTWMLAPSGKAPKAAKKAPVKTIADIARKHAPLNPIALAQRHVRTTLDMLTSLVDFEDGDAAQALQSLREAIDLAEYVAA